MHTFTTQSIPYPIPDTQYPIPNFFENFWESGLPYLKIPDVKIEWSPKYVAFSSKDEPKPFVLGGTQHLLRQCTSIAITMLSYPGHSGIMALCGFKP